MKFRRSNKKVCPHGGIVPVLKQLKQYGIPKIIRNCLGKRRHNAKYSHEDILLSWVLTCICGGKRLDHITKIKKKLSILDKEIQIPSHDTLGRGMKSLATEPVTEIIKSDVAVVSNSLDDNMPLNRALVKATKAIGALEEHRKHTLDIDATFVSTHSRVAERRRGANGKVNMEKVGFNPMVCLIGDLPVFVSMRNGFAGAAYKLTDCLTKCLNLLDEEKIRIGRVVSDAAGYNKEFFEQLDRRGIDFIVRMKYNVKMYTFNDLLHKCDTWRKTNIETVNYILDCEIAEIPYKMWDHPQHDIVPSPTRRVIAMRIPAKTMHPKFSSEDERQRHRIVKRQLIDLKKRNLLKDAYNVTTPPGNKWIRIGDYLYKFFITSDFKDTPEGIVKAYNKRGDAERKFSFLKQDWSWARPAFYDRMQDNTVFLLAACLANNLFKGVLKNLKKFIPELQLTWRITEFQFQFINISCGFVNGEYVFYRTDIAFEKIV